MQGISVHQDLGPHPHICSVELACEDSFQLHVISQSCDRGGIVQALASEGINTLQSTAHVLTGATLAVGHIHLCGKLLNYLDLPQVCVTCFMFVTHSVMNGCSQSVTFKQV